MTFSSGPLLGGSDAYMDGNPIDRNALGTLIALGLVILLSRNRQVVALLSKNAPLLLYFSYCGVSVLWSDFPAVGFRRWPRALGDFVMIMVILTDPDWFAAIKRLLKRAGFVLIPLSILFIRYYPNLGRAYGNDGSQFWSGITGGKNSLGMICMLFGLGSLWRFLLAYQAPVSPERKGRLIAHSVFLLMVIYLLYEANSATSLSCFGLAGAVLVIVMTREGVARKPALVSLLVVAVISFALFALFFDPGGGLVGTLGRNATLTGRTDIWKRAFAIVQNPIFGTGFETFWLGKRLEWMRMLDSGLNHAHDGYVEIYLNLGLVGLTLLALVMVKGYRNIIGGLKYGRDGAPLMLAYFIVGVIYSCTESGFKMMSPIWIFFLLAVTVRPETIAAANIVPRGRGVARQVTTAKPRIRQGAGGAGWREDSRVPAYKQSSNRIVSI